MNELLRPWKLFSLACGLALLIAGSFYYDAPDWDIPISFIMALLAYLTASWSMHVIVERRWKSWPAMLLATWFTVDGCYWIYWHFKDPFALEQMRAANFPASLSLYWMCGLVWFHNGSLAELRAAVRRMFSGPSGPLRADRGEPFTEAEAKARLLAELKGDADRHDAGEYFDVGMAFDEFEARYPRGAGAAADRLVFALEFWASWVDANGHDWKYYAPIRKDDWPRYARIVAADLAADRATTEPVLVELFSPRKD